VRPRTGILVALALVAGLIGGLIGGYIGARPASPRTSQGYNPGPIPSAQTNRPPGSVAAIAARMLPSVVMIKVNDGEGTGSGFVVDGGYIVTNNHVVTLDGQDKTAPLQVVFSGGQSVAAKLVGADPFSDLAVIRPEGGPDLQPVQLGNSAGVDVGDPVVAVGSPLGLAGTVTSGIVSALHRAVQAGNDQEGAAGGSSEAYIDAIQTDAPINPGNSGGPLVNGQAQVIGVTSVIATLGGGSLGSAGQSGSIGLGFAIPVDQARGVIQQLVETGKAVHPVIGAVLISDYTGDGAKISPSQGGGQPSVAPGGPAARAGLEAGDVIVALDGQPVHSMDDLIAGIRSHRPGDKVRLTYLRGGARHNTVLVLGSAPSS
jgi:putative serine protease PepD